MPIQETGSGDTRRRPIALGGALITVVEPRRGHEVAYNRWYERDHFYAGCMIGQWNISGARYVATRDLKALRYPKNSVICPDDTSASYVAIYWILAGKFGEWMQWGTDQVNWLHENGRMFAERDHAHTVMYKYRTQYETADGVPVELALEHYSPYAVLIVGQPAEGVALDAIDVWFGARELPGVVGAEFTPVPLQGDAPSDVPRTDATNQFAQLWFVDDELADVWEARFAALGEEFAAAGLGELLWVAPFRRTIAGTDTYTDQLW